MILYDEKLVSNYNIENNDLIILSTDFIPNTKINPSPNKNKITNIEKINENILNTQFIKNMDLSQFQKLLKMKMQI